jgi:hypothetical protein
MLVEPPLENVCFQDAVSGVSSAGAALEAEDA